MTAKPTYASRDLDSLTPRQQERLAEALSECLDAMERGESPNLPKLLAENADIADLIRSNVNGLRLLQAAGDAFPSESRSEAAASETPSTGKKELGDFQILREVGRGGMGVVYEAHQMSLDRKVALKILPFAAVLDQKQIARFKNEARAAAQLHHTNIVPVYSVGCEKGVHYYSMQFIEGCPLDKALGRIRADVPTASLCDADAEQEPSRVQSSPAAHSTIAAGSPHVPTAGGFSLAGSLDVPDHGRAVAEIGVQVARALQHAHDFGIVHRDVKPSNLLLDDRGKVWVTDFGLAFFQADSRVTLSGDIVGTLRYMSPEQACGKAGIVDQRTDVYSLGITLYELLTLCEAFDGDNRQAILNQVENEEPIPPRRIDPSIPKDLETIVLKATAKLREERYNTAGELADDLERFLRGEPTLARRATVMERCAKWARRHKTVVRWTVALGFVLLIGLTITTTEIAIAHSRVSEAKHRMELALEASEKNRLLAEENEAKAEEHFRKATKMVDLIGLHYAEDLSSIAGAESLRRRVLEDSLNFYRDIVATACGDPTLQRDLAAIYGKIGKVSETTGNRAEAIEAFRSAQETLKKLIAKNPDDADAKQDLALCDNNIGLLLARDGRTDAARTAYQKAIDVQRKLAETLPKDERVRNDLALTCQNLSVLEHQTANDKAAVEAALESVRIEEELVRSNPRELGYHRQLATGYMNLGRFQSTADPASAEQYLLNALRIQKELADRYPDDLNYKNDLVLNYNYLGTLQRNQGDLDRAEEYYAQARRLDLRLAKQAPAVVKYRLDTAVSENNLGRIYCEKGEYAKAERVFRNAETQLAKLVAEYPENVYYRSTLGGTLNNLGRVLENLGRREEAADIYAKSIDEQRRAYQAAPTVDQFRQFLRRQYANYIRVLKELDRGEEAQDAEASLKEITGRLQSPLKNSADET